MLKKSRFKYFLIPQADLAREACELKEDFRLIFTAYDHGELTAPQLVFLFIVIICHQRRPGEWWMKGASGLSFLSPPHDVVAHVFRRLQFPTPIASLQEFFGSYKLKKLPLGISQLLCEWDRGTVQLDLLEAPITPIEMLKLQSQGRRVVTLSREASVKGVLVDGQRDSLEFLLHDLAHGQLFFSQNHQEQVLFFRDTLRELEQGCYEEFLQDPHFRKDFEYVISDMNSHGEHLKFSLQSAIIETRKRSQGPVRVNISL